MKQLIVPIAIIVTLFAFFVIVDRKVFSHCNDVQSVHGKNNTAKMKQWGPVSGGGDGRVGEHRQIIATWLEVVEHGSEKKTAETDAAEVLSNTDTNYPVAVPVITAEEAFKANEEALRLLLENR